MTIYYILTTTNFGSKPNSYVRKSVCNLVTLIQYLEKHHLINFGTTYNISARVSFDSKALVAFSPSFHFRSVTEFHKRASDVRKSLISKIYNV